MFGLRPEDYEVPEIALWPCCADSVAVFLGMSSQWRAGPNGIVGLVYEAIPIVMKALGMRRKRLREIFSDLRIMEFAALAEAHKD